MELKTNEVGNVNNISNLNLGAIFHSCTIGIFNFVFWELKLFIEKRKGFVPQTFAYLSVLLIAILPLFYLIIDFFVLTPLANFKPLLFFGTIGAVTIALSMRHSLEKHFFFLVLIVNIIQGFGLFHLAEHGELSFLLLILLLIQAVLVMPSLDSFGKSQLIDLFNKNGQKYMFNRFSRISKNCPRSISQFYRDYVYLVACVMLLLTSNIISQINVMQTQKDSIINVINIGSFSQNPSSTVFFIFLISLLLILLRNNTTDYISGWGRNIYSNMKENFNLIIAIYTMIGLIFLMSYIFSIHMNRYQIDTNDINQFLKSYAIIDIIFICIIFYNIFSMANKLKSNPKYEISQLTQKMKIENNKGSRLISYDLKNYDNNVILCKIIKHNKLKLSIDMRGRVLSIPANKSITKLSFEYDKSQFKKKGLNYDFIDVSISERKYKHRLYFSALHTKSDNSKDENFVSLDRYLIIEKLIFDPRRPMIITSKIGVYNPTNKAVKVKIHNRNELISKSIDVYFMDNKGQRYYNGLLTLQPNTHKPNIIVINCDYKKSLINSSTPYITASIIFEIDGSDDTLQIPYILDVEPKIYNDTNEIITIEYPDSSRDTIKPSEIVEVKGTNIPVKATYSNRYSFFDVQHGLNLLSTVTQGEKKSFSKSFYTEISLVGLKRSGKTTYITTLGMEVQKEQGSVIIIHNFRDKIIRKTFETNRKLIEEQKTFPPETSEKQFDSFYFNVEYNKNEYTLGIKDIAGEFFGSDKHIDDNECLSETAKRHFSESDFIFITIDTSPNNLVVKDTKNTILLTNIKENETINTNNIRILFTKTDISGLKSDNNLKWLSECMPQVYNHLINILKLDPKRQFYYISIGEVQKDNPKKISKYSPVNLVDPILDIITRTEK